MATLYYGDGREYAVEPFDRVEINAGGRCYDGVITKIFSKVGQVRVRFTDHENIARTTGEPRIRSGRFSIGAVELVARDG